jgi:hypothetical protein
VERTGRKPEWFTPLTDPRIHPVAFPWSRFFCDVERLENDPLEKSGQGIVYTSFEGINRNLTVQEKERSLYLL